MLTYVTRLPQPVQCMLSCLGGGAGLEVAVGAITDRNPGGPAVMTEVISNTLVIATQKNDLMLYIVCSLLGLQINGGQSKSEVGKITVESWVNSNIRP